MAQLPGRESPGARGREHSVSSFGQTETNEGATVTGERQVVLSVEVQDTDLAEQLALRGFDVVEGGGVNANNYLWRKVNSETVTKSVLGLDT